MGNNPYSAFFVLISSSCSAFLAVFEADVVSATCVVSLVDGCDAGTGVAGATGADAGTGGCAGTVES